MICKPALLPAAAGLIVAAIDFAGLTGENFFWGALELICGCLAGTGLAALWMRQDHTVQEKIVIGLLLICHVLSFWLWIPFAAGLFCRDTGQTEPDRSWYRRVLFLILTILCGAGGYALFYWGWSSPQPDIPQYQTITGLLTAVLAPLFAARYLLAAAWQDAWIMAFRFPALYAGMLLLCSLYKLRLRAPEAWYIYAGLLLICIAAIAGGWRRKLSAGLSKIQWGAWCAILFLITWHMALDCRLDQYYFGYHRTQKYYLKNFQENSPPILEACRQYRAKYNAWPDDPGQLKEFMEIPMPGSLTVTGCHTDANGDFRIFLKRPRRVWVMAYHLRPDGTATWEYAAPNHPQRKPGDRRWKHFFPYTD